MRPAFMPLGLAAAVTVLIGLGVWLDPYFPGDVALTRALQSAFPDPDWWATPISRIASAPAKYFVMGLTLGISLGLGGWKGAAVGAGAMLLDQYGAEASKAVFARPRPSADLVAVAGSPSGFTFPSGTLTFFSVTFGWMLIQAQRAKPGSIRTALLAVMPLALLLGCLARVVLGAHWPSDVVLTVVICRSGLWEGGRGVGV